MTYALGKGGLHLRYQMADEKKVKKRRWKKADLSKKDEVKKDEKKKAMSAEEMMKKRYGK